MYVIIICFLVGCYIVGNMLSLKNDSKIVTDGYVLFENYIINAL